MYTFTSAKINKTIQRLLTSRNKIPGLFNMHIYIIISLLNIYVRLFFLTQRKVRILSKFCDVHIELKYISSNWMLFEKQSRRHSLWHVTSRDTCRFGKILDIFPQ